MDNYFKEMTNEELNLIRKDIERSTMVGNRAESLVSCAKKIKESFGDTTLPLYVALDFAKKQYYEEVTRRFFQSLGLNDGE